MQDPHRDDDLDAVVQSGEQLPAELAGEPLCTDETLMETPVFDGEKIVDQARK